MRAPGRVWGRRIPGVRDLVVSAQVALSVVLLVVAGLVLRTLVTADNLDPGFTYDPLVEAQISTSSISAMACSKGDGFVAARFGRVVGADRVELLSGFE